MKIENNFIYKDPFTGYTPGTVVKLKQSFVDKIMIETGKPVWPVAEFICRENDRYCQELCANWFADSG